MDDPTSFTPLLAPDEPPAYAIERAGASPWVITVDHASPLLPRALGSLGLGAADLARHIAWDIGAAAVARDLAERLDAWLIVSGYSRLAIDLNRPPDVASSIPTRSETTDIPGNAGLTDAERTRRRVALFDPYHAAIAAELDRRGGAIYVAMHSFTPVYAGVARPMPVGVLYNRDPRLARALLARLRNEVGPVGDNEPYSVSDETDYGVPVHAERRRLPHVEIEVRQDLIADAAGAAEWAERLARLLPAAARDAGL